jgi:Uma2 family endonuclease
MLTTTKKEILYPESDGKPMADNSIQFNWIVYLKSNLDRLLKRAPNVVVIGNMLWYAVEDEPSICAAPDVMVIFGRPKRERGSYKQWLEEDVSPQVVFEILSPSNTRREMREKREWYERYGVEEYYEYDPDRNRLKIWIREGETLREIVETAAFRSPLLEVRFELNETTMTVYFPNGKAFESFLELDERADEERTRADEERTRSNRERERVNKLATKLRELGIDPESL